MVTKIAGHRAEISAARNGIFQRERSSSADRGLPESTIGVEMAAKLSKALGTESPTMPWNR